MDRVEQHSRVKYIRLVDSLLGWEEKRPVVRQIDR